MSIFGRKPDPDPDRRKSDWLVMEQSKRPGTEACKDCKGTGSSGFVSAKGETIACESCGGFGY